MTREYLILLAASYLTAQTLKYFIKFFRVRKFSFKHLVQTYSYYSGPPSAHTATITTTLWHLGDKVGIQDPIFLVASFFSYLWLFEILMQRKRYNSSTNIFKPFNPDSDDLDLLKELSGHEKLDIALGLAIGTLVYLLLQPILQNYY